MQTPSCLHWICWAVEPHHACVRDYARLVQHTSLSIRVCMQHMTTPIRPRRPSLRVLNPRLDFMQLAGASAHSCLPGITVYLDPPTTYPQRETVYL